MRSPMRTMAASMLVLEAFVVFFAGLVAKDLSGISTRAALAVFGALALACLVTAGVLRSRVGFVLGSVLQVAVIATGVLVPAMFFLGAVFAGLWLAALVQGRRIERERAAWPQRPTPSAPATSSPPST